LQPAPRYQVLIAFALIYLIWGSTYLGIRFAIETLPPFLMAGLRFLIAGGLMYGWMRLRAGDARPTAIEWRGAALVGGFLLLGGNGGVVWAQQQVPSGLAALLVATVPLWMVLLEWLGGGHRPRLRVMAGIAIGFAGLGILVNSTDLLGGRAVSAVGAAVLVMASFSWAIGSVLSRRVRLPASPLLGTGMEMIAGGVLLLLAGTLAGEWGTLDLAAASTRSVAAFLYLVVFGSLVGFTAYIWLLRHVEIAKVATYAYVNPVVAVLLGWALAGEPLTLRILVAAAVIILGVFFITSGRARPAMERPETAGAAGAAAADPPPRLSS
jgi:drug/metabolite transporter (DMT)-like permease